MPTYEYHCKECGHQMDHFQKITDEPLKICPECNKETLHRGPGGGIGLSFKGTGFYITDYGPSSQSAAPKSDECCPCGKDKCDS